VEIEIHGRENMLNQDGKQGLLKGNAKQQVSFQMEIV
jgi:hypothetical protein